MSYLDVSYPDPIRIIDFNYAENQMRKMLYSLITDVEIIVPDKVIEVTFCDGSKQKAVCQEGDTFSLEQGITICLCKHYLGSSSRYNNVVRKVIKDYERKIAKEKEAEEKKKEEARVSAKKKAKKDAYFKKCREKENQRQIAIMKDAFVQAMVADVKNL